MIKNRIGNTFFIFIKKLKQKMKVLKKYWENFIQKRNGYIPYGYEGLNHKVQIFHSERKRLSRHLARTRGSSLAKQKF